ncbi:MAG TPA: selenocysteine-specific translation elongation factor [Candidatus Sulfotelmatobacter sp.]|jgi:selenocysteine-specific elongation factor|nr:selenocysteine-specific translation elongation factor [Candidatus Sulfotelmatobacter sp.]
MSNSTKSIIVGTAGHIDHGKSTLIEALTGTHPDRLEEEKRRGITIDLGFAFLEEEGVRYGFVDVPGHERFVKNMLAGASGIDLVLLVIAADELIKPQTREHFDICRLLGVQRGVVALTKSDLADSDTRELARMEIEEFVKGTFLAGAPIVEVSAKTKRGLAELKAALQEAAREISAKDTRRYFRLPIDRSFAVKGFGSVVTGTLFSGHVAVGEEVELLPSGKVLRVRGLQTGGKSVERAEAGQRAAVNLAGIEHTAIQRGMVLTSRGRLRTTRRADVRLELLPGSPALKHRAQVHFHAGTLETTGEVYLLGTRELGPGGSALAQIRLQDDAVLVRSDRFIVRQFSPVVTIGGGVVLDPLARRFTVKDTSRAQFLATLETRSREDVLRAMAERHILGITAEEIIVRTGWIEAEIQSAAKTLADKKLLRIVSNEPLILMAEALFGEIGKKLLARVERFHKENPLLPGITREELKASLGRRVRPETFAAALQTLLEQKKITLQGEFIKKAGTEITLAPEELRARDQITQAFAKAGLTVPSVKEVLAQLKIETARSEKLLQILLREKVLVRVSADLVFHHDALDALTGLLAQYKKSKGERIGVPAFKELTGITRKYAIPLLEYLDRQRQTRRAGDERVIL